MITTVIILSAALVIVGIAFVVCLIKRLQTDRDLLRLTNTYDELLRKAEKLESEKDNLLQEAGKLSIEDAKKAEKIDLLNKRIEELNDSIKDLTAKRAEQAQTIIQAEAQKAELCARLDNAKKLIEETKARQAELNKQTEENFKVIANDILKQNSNDFKQANELSAALRGNKNNTQGPWGETILRQILEGSGLIEGVNFTLQATHNPDGSKIDGDYRPDALLYLPDKKVLVVDSKVNITSYVDYANAENDNDRKQLLAEHVKAVELQIGNLSKKGYQNAVKNSADFVIMFMPNEGAYIAAMHGDPELWNKAYNKHVLLVSPTHLISVVKMMEQLWNNDKQNRNAIAIAEESGKLIDKLAAFVNDMSNVGDNLNKASRSYDSAMNKLRDGKGNILSRADKIAKLGAKATRQLPANGESDE